VLRDVGAAGAESALGRAGTVGVAVRDRVGREEDLDLVVGEALAMEALESLGDALREGGDEARVVEELAHLVDLDGTAQAGGLDGVGEIFAVLAARRVRAVRAGRDREQAAVAGVMGVLQGVGDVGHPVAVAPVHRQLQAARRELGIQRRLQLTVVLVDRRHPAEVTVVMGDLFEALVRDAAARRDVAQERDHVLLTLGSAEAQQQHTVIRDGALTCGSPAQVAAVAAGTRHPSPQTGAALARGGLGRNSAARGRCSRPSAQHLRQLVELERPV
jgi:hypothetical protein